jgi:PAS domain S-box-containing protein
MENELSRVVDALPGLVWTALPNGRVDFLNRGWCEYTGMKLAEAYNSGWQSAVHPEDLPGLLERWRVILTSGQPGEIEARFRRFDKEYRRFLIRTVPVHNEQGKIMRWYGISVDDTDQGLERQRSQISLTRALDELKKSEDKLRTIIDTMPTIAWCALPDGSGEFWNQRWHEYTGLSPEAARGWGWQKLIHPEDVERITDTWLAHLAAGQPGEIEGRLRRFDGEYRWFLFRFEPLRDESGKIVNWYGINTDIDDRKRAEALLAGEKRLLEMVASGRPLPVVLNALCELVEATIDGCYCGIVLVDPTGTQLEHGAAPSLPASYNDSINGRPVNLEAGPCAMAVALNAQVICADVPSETRWAAYAWSPLALAHGLKACWSTPILCSEGKPIGAFAIYYAEPTTPTPEHQALIEQFTHIAGIAIERTRREEALRQSELFLAEAQRLSSTGSFYWRVATDEILWSQQAYRIYEFDPAVTMTPQLIRTRIHPEDVDAFDEIIDRARRVGGDYDNEHRLQMPDGSIKYLRVVAHGTLNQNGDLEYIGAIHDITARRVAEIAFDKARSELAHVARVSTLGALTASIAHEVNQPLAGIITNASTGLRMLAGSPLNLDGARETMRRTLRDAERACDVIKRLRSLFAKKSAFTDSVDLNEAVREVIGLSFRELQRNHVLVRAELADNLPYLTADRVQLQQVILNLLLNASEAMSTVVERQKQVVIRTALDTNDWVRLSVRDTGVGFDPKSIEKLFEAFYTTKSRGMGIGLSVSRSIIDSHGGHLWAALNHGPGATFSFSIPPASAGVTRDHSVSDMRTSPVAETEPVMGSW